MPKLWVNEMATPEGKYPVVLRRDGTQFESMHFLISVHDPGFHDAMMAYAARHASLGSDTEFVDDCRAVAAAADGGCFGIPPRRSDPDAPPHRTDHPAVLLWSRRCWTLAEFVGWCLVALDTCPRNLGLTTRDEVLAHQARVDLATEDGTSIPVSRNGRVVAVSVGEYTAWKKLQEEGSDDGLDVPTTSAGA